MFTPTLVSQHHRNFRCLGLAGPPVLFSLNPSAGPTRQSHCCSSLSRNCRPAPVPVRRSAAARAPPARHSKPPPRPSSSLRHRTRSPTLAHAAPQPYARPSRVCATHAPPLTTAVGLSLSKRQQAFSTVLLHSFFLARVFKPDLKFSAPLFRCTQGVRGIAT